MISIDIRQEYVIFCFGFFKSIFSTKFKKSSVWASSDIKNEVQKDPLKLTFFCTTFQTVKMHSSVKSERDEKQDKFKHTLINLLEKFIALDKFIEKNVSSIIIIP